MSVLFCYGLCNYTTIRIHNLSNNVVHIQSSPLVPPKDFPSTSPPNPGSNYRSHVAFMTSVNSSQVAKAAATSSGEISFIGAFECRSSPGPHLQRQITKLLGSKVECLCSQKDPKEAAASLDLVTTNIRSAAVNLSRCWLVLGLLSTRYAGHCFNIPVSM